jgi:hypothetical protein
MVLLFSPVSLTVAVDALGIVTVLADPVNSIALMVAGASTVTLLVPPVMESFSTMPDVMVTALDVPVTVTVKVSARLMVALDAIANTSTFGVVVTGVAGAVGVGAAVVLPPPPQAVRHAAAVRPHRMRVTCFMGPPCL